jgi:DNA-binding transcriptional regulator YhcF (GntR family)
VKVTINRESAIPLHDQLVQQIALLIAAGVLQPGERLPSIRDLARRLDIHPNTVSAVYKALDSHGVVTVRQGSGVRVIEHGKTVKEGAVLSLPALAESFVLAANAAGHRSADISRAFMRALHPEPIERLVVVDPHPDFHPLYLHELGRWFGCPIATLTLEDLARAGQKELDGAAIATSMYHLAATQDVVGADRRVFVFRVSTGEDLLEVVRAIPDGQMLALVSVSRTMLDMANDLVAGLRGQELLLLEAGLDDPERLRSVVRLADVIATDGPSADVVQALTNKSLLTLELLPKDSLHALAAQLPSEILRTHGLRG